MSAQSKSQGIQVDNPADLLAELPMNPYLDSASKRALDVVGAIGIGVALSPVLCVVTGTLLCQRGPVLFRHQRVGRAANEFWCNKFRTMVVDAESKLQEVLSSSPDARKSWEKEFKLKNDPRVTRVGRFLRKSSFDELPQLVNVLKGEMSLVGPRPVVEAEMEQYGSHSAYYLACKPGLTGIWQASGRSNIQYSRRVAMDRLYAKDASFSLDVKIIGKTVWSVLSGSGAY